MGKNATPHEIIARAEERRREEARQIIDSKRREYMRDELGLSNEKIEKIISNEPASWVVDAVAEARSNADELGEQLAAAQAEARALLEERDELAKDAARYRWLRDREIPEWLDLCHQNPDRIDAAIDAAMEGGGRANERLDREAAV